MDMAHELVQHKNNKNIQRFISRLFQFKRNRYAQFGTATGLVAGAHQVGGLANECQCRFVKGLEPGADDYHAADEFTVRREMRLHGDDALLTHAPGNHRVLLVFPEH
jgi:hypothetical protein